MIGGLYEIVKVIMRQENVPDGYGGVKLVFSVINNHYRCRFCRSSVELTGYLSFAETRWTPRPQGLGEKLVYIVLGEYDPNIKKGMLLEKRNDRNEIERWEILQMDPQKDAAGNYRFWKMTVEQLS